MNENLKECGINCPNFFIGKENVCGKRKNDGKVKKMKNKIRPERFFCPVKILSAYDYGNSFERARTFNIRSKTYALSTVIDSAESFWE